MNILIVDDSPTNLELLRAQLESKGHTVLEAADGIEALAVLEREKVDAVISDILMPRMDGYRLCYEVRRNERLKQLPFIVYSSIYTSPEDEKLASDVQVDKYLRKPASMDDIAAALQEVTSKPHAAPQGGVMKEAEVLKEYSQRLVARLEQKNEELQMILDAVPAIIFYKDRQHRLVRVNASCARAHGRSAAEFAGKTDSDLGLPHAEQYVRDEEEVAATGQPKRNIIEPMVGLAGTRWWQTDKFPIRDEAGAITGFIGFSLDITERKQVEEALGRAESQYRGIFENSVEGIAQTMPEGRILTANPAFARMLGYESAEALLAASLLMGRDVYVNPEDRKTFLDMIAENNICNDFQCQFKRKDGQVFWVSINASAARDAAGTVQFYNFTCMDISERLKAEQRLREQAALLDLTSEAIIVRDLSHRITFWNKGAESLYGWTAEEAVGQIVTELYASIAWDGREAARRQVLEQGRWEGELHQKTKAGKQLIVDSRWTLLWNATGAPEAILAINSDITEKKQIEAQFLRSQRMESMGALAGGVAHDLNNVLSPILMAAQLLHARATDDRTKELLEMIEAGTKRGANMIRQILSFARGTEGEKGLMQVRHLLKDIVKMMKDTFPPNIYCESNVASELWPVLGDATQLYQVLLNLCVNSRDAMSNGGKIVLTAENITLDETYAKSSQDARRGPYVVLTVTDNGSGIPKEHQEKIFEPFFSTKEPGKGTGLGLSTVKQIIARHGGFIHLYSETGNGTQFKIYIPAVVGEQDKSATTIFTLPVGHGELVLVVDDEAAVREIVKATLENYGYRVVTACDGTEAVARFFENRQEVRALLTDMQMPHMDGTATIRALRNIQPDLRVLVASGLTSHQEALSNVGLSVQGFVAKPFTAASLLLELDTVIKGGKPK